MSDIEKPSTGIKVLENVVIKRKDSDVDCTTKDVHTGDVQSSGGRDNLDCSVEKEISEIVQHSDPISPATAIPTKDATPLSDDDTPKIILNLEVSPIQKDSSISAEDSPDNTEIKVSMDQLDQLMQKKTKNKSPQKDPLSISSIQVEKITTKLDQNGKPPMKLHNRILASSSNTKDLDRDLGQVTISVEKSKKIVNPVPDPENNDDLVAILEGHDVIDDKDGEEEHYEVVEIIPDSESKTDSTSGSSVLTKEEERKIALEQMSTIPKPNRGRKRKTPAADESASATELVSSLASEWSDGEKEAEGKSTEQSKEKKSAGKKEALEKKNVVEPKIEPFKRTRVIKKKIIWDPDAPETQFSYASLVQSSAKKQPPQKKTRTTPTPTPKKVEPPNTKTYPTAQQKGKRRSVTPTILNNKKKKLSEIDKLLGDEGAANMINAVENEKPEKEKDSRIKKEPISPNTEKTPTPKKRVIKPKSAAASWDYVYNQRNDDAMIIRRRSNSSYSSTSPRRLSLEQSPAMQSKKASPGNIKISPGSKVSQTGTKVSPGVTKMVAVNVAKGKNFEFARPEAKKVKKEEVSPTTIATDIRKTELRESLRKSSRTPVNVESNEVQSKPQVKAEKDKPPEVVVKKHGNITELLLHPKVDKVKNTFTSQLMNEVVKQLDLLKADNGCKVVFLTTAGQHFCQGVDFVPLTVGSVEKRKTAATDLAASVKNFLQALASFPKPILAGVTGTCSGLGVTMLPLFDVVISSDKSTFDTSYAKIGQIPEGHCILTLTNNVRHNFKTKLLWLCEKINSTEAALSGLVTKLTSPAKIQDDTLLCAKKVATLSQQTFSSMKTQRQKSELPKLMSALAEEQKILTQQWVSAECQEKFKQFLQKDCW